MSSLYAQYVLERTSDKIIEIPEGFATYRYVAPDCVYIIDLFVKPEFRKQGTAKILASRICAEAKKHGAKKLLGTVVPSMKNSTVSISVLIAYGMKLQSSSENLIVLEKEI